MEILLETRAADAPVEAARPGLALKPLLAVAAVITAAHLAVNLFGPYVLHRDALLYLAMGEHLRLWSMDFPPFIALLARATRFLLGDSTAAIRAGPMLAHGLLILLAGVLAREFGGGRFAQLLAAVGVALAPIFLRPGSLFQPVVFDQLWWTLALLSLARIGRSAVARGDAGDPLAWVGLGLAGGLGLLTKFSIGFIAVGILVGLLVSPQRRALLTRWPWEAALLALLIGLPSVVGQVRLGFPVVGQLGDLRASQLSYVGYLDFISGQVLYLGPLAILAVLGFARLAASRRYLVVAVACAATFLLLMALHGKPYYVAPIYPALTAAGAAALELWTAPLHARAAGRAASAVVRGLILALVLLFGAATLPLGLPLLPPAPMAAYAHRLGVEAAVRTNQRVALTLPQDYADMLGWPEQAAAVARVYRALPPDKRAQAVLIGENYGEAGAIDFYGRRWTLPPAIATVGSYWFFGPGEKPGNVAVILGADTTELKQYFRVVRPVFIVRNPWGVPEEREVVVAVAEEPYRTLQQLWPGFAGRN